MVQTFSVPAHPYFPPDAEIPHYIPNATSVHELLVRFASLLCITIFTALWLATRFNSQMRSSDKFIFGWFVLCKSIDSLFVLGLDPSANENEGGSLHCFFEGTGPSLNSHHGSVQEVSDTIFAMQRIFRPKPRQTRKLARPLRPAVEGVRPV